MAEQDLPGGGEPGPARPAFDEAVAGLLLQGGELLGDGGGRQVQRGGGRGHRAVVGHRTEDSQPPRIDHVPIVPGRAGRPDPTDPPAGACSGEPAVPPGQAVSASSAVRASTKASTARFTSSVECAAESWTRMRAAPCGTTGYENPIT